MSHCTPKRKVMKKWMDVGIVCTLNYENSTKTCEISKIFQPVHERCSFEFQFFFMMKIKHFRAENCMHWRCSDLINFSSFDYFNLKGLVPLFDAVSPRFGDLWRKVIRFLN